MSVHVSDCHSYLQKQVKTLFIVIKNVTNIYCILCMEFNSLNVYVCLRGSKTELNIKLSLKKTVVEKKIPLKNSFLGGGMFFILHVSIIKINYLKNHIFFKCCLLIHVFTRAVPEDCRDMTFWNFFLKNRR